MSASEEERVALECIYPDDLLTVVDSKDGWLYVFELPLSDSQSHQRLQVTFRMPLEGYPVASPPTITAECIRKHSPSTTKDDSSFRWTFAQDENAWARGLAEELARLWTGQVMVFDAVELAKDRWETFTRDHLKCEAANISDHPTFAVQLSPSKSPPRLTIHHSSDPVVEKKSVFIAHCAAITSRDQVHQMQQQLLETFPRYATATHNIVAYRYDMQIQRPSSITATENSTDILVQQDFEDDGETAAGGRLLRMMELAGCRNVAVVVSRWYGGVQLGPRRFKLINDVARDLLVEHGWIPKAR